MLPDILKDQAVAVAIEAFDADAISGGKFGRAELTIEIAPSKIVSVGGFLKYDQKFVRLASVTVVDLYPQEPRFAVVYHLQNIEKRARLRLKCLLNGANPSIESLTGVWRSANWYEREAWDLFGVRFTGHPGLKRIMMPEEWEGHPLRKDYPVTGSRV